MALVLQKVRYVDDLRMLRTVTPAQAWIFGFGRGTEWVTERMQVRRVMNGSMTGNVHFWSIPEWQSNQSLPAKE